MAESIKRHLATAGKSSEALIFADLYTKSCTISNGFLDSALAGGLPTLSEGEERSGNFGEFGKLSKNLSVGVFNNGFDDLRGLSDNVWNVRSLSSLEKLESDRGDRNLGTILENSSGLSENMKKLKGLGDNSRGLRAREHLEKKYNGGILMVSKDPDNIRDMAYREFVDLIKDESEVSEVVLVRDVLYACQGIDGKYVKFDEKVDAYDLPELLKVPRATKIMVRKLCEVGWLFRKVKGYIKESMDQFPAEDVGTVGQAFCAALQDELSDYYKLLAVLEAQAMNLIPLVSENAGSSNYLSLRRLSVWFTEPMVKMRLMAVLIDICKVLKGGAMAGAIHRD